MPYNAGRVLWGLLIMHPWYLELRSPHVARRMASETCRNTNSYLAFLSPQYIHRKPGEDGQSDARCAGWSMRYVETGTAAHPASCSVGIGLISQGVMRPGSNTVAARTKVWVCGRSLAGIAGSNPASGMDVCLLRVFSVVR